MAYVLNHLLVNGGNSIDITVVFADDQFVTIIGRSGTLDAEQETGKRLVIFPKLEKQDYLFVAFSIMILHAEPHVVIPII